MQPCGCAPSECWGFFGRLRSPRGLFVHVQTNIQSTITVDRCQDKKTRKLYFAEDQIKQNIRGIIVYFVCSMQIDNMLHLGRFGVGKCLLVGPCWGLFLHFGASRAAKGRARRTLRVISVAVACGIQRCLVVYTSPCERIPGLCSAS